MKRYLIAIGIGLLIIVGMSLFTHHMRVLVNEWAETGVVIPLQDRILLGVAAHWMHWGIFLAPFILAACVGIALLTDILKPGRP